MNDIYILGIESSCDETSIAIVKNGREVISLSTATQIPIHQEYGGVVPEIASREHLRNITYVLEDCLKKGKMKISEMNAIAVTYKPGLIGSLLVGLEAAKTLAWLYHKPLILVDHLSGHILANNLNKEIMFPTLGLIISGGHTEIVVMKSFEERIVLGKTLDDAIGECYDKVARTLGLLYPGGPMIEKEAAKGNPTYDLPLPLNDKSLNFSFSGLKSAVLNLVKKEERNGQKVNISDLACSFQKVVEETFYNKVKRAIRETHLKRLVVAGGVAANKGLRKKLEELCEEEKVALFIPDIKYCTDNGAMIGAAGYYYYNKKEFSDLLVSAEAND